MQEKNPTLFRTPPLMRANPFQRIQISIVISIKIMGMTPLNVLRLGTNRELRLIGTTIGICRNPYEQVKNDQPQSSRKRKGNKKEDNENIYVVNHI